MSSENRTPQSNADRSHEEQGLDNVVGQSAQESRILRLMMISNEFVTMRDSMEIFPLPGNEVEPESSPSQNYVQNAACRLGQGRTTDLMVFHAIKAEFNQTKIRDLVTNAADELLKLSLEKEPLWQYHDPSNRDTEILNHDEYNKRFSNILDETLEEIIKLIAVDAPLNVDINLDCSSTDSISGDYQRTRSPKMEASRARACIQMPPLSVVYVFMDVKLWSFFFSDMLARAMVLGILEPGTPTLDGALQVMSAEYHGPSVLLRTRESYFARYCKMLSHNVWIVVDVSLEDLIMNNPFMNCKRKPSGCLIEGLPDGSTKVTWIEHVEADTGFFSPLFKPFVESEFMYGAKRWIDVLVRQSERLELLVQHAIANLLPGNPESAGMDRILRLAEQMRRLFFGALSATKSHLWKAIPVNGPQDILVNSREVPGDAAAAFLTATTSFWLPIKAKTVFQYLNDEKNQIKGHMLGDGYRIDEALHLRGAITTDNVVSAIRMVETEENKTSIMLQEAQESTSGSYVVFAPLDLPVMASLLDGDDASSIGILPSGFVILPHHPGCGQGEGSVVTVALQLFDRSARPNFIPDDSVAILLDVVMECETNIRNAMLQLLHI